MKESKYAGTQTEKNLMAAFAGESEARNKYTYFASKAKKEGYEQIRVCRKNIFYELRLGVNGERAGVAFAVIFKCGSELLACLFHDRERVGDVLLNRVLVI